ncbi:hypothetical protein, partial [Parvimonas micra]|uniref:hypothetical protein n=1 Tax=Parvimonas micra TaxID=33033 RepID=UPI002B45FDEE
DSRSIGYYRKSCCGKTASLQTTISQLIKAMIMSIEKTWRDIDEQSDEALLSLLQPKALNKLQSKNPLSTIRKNLLR